jgi:hypothetical protein
LIIVIEISTKIITIRPQNMPASTSFLSDSTEAVDAPGSDLFRRVVNPNKKSESFFLYDRAHDKDWQRLWNSTQWRIEHPKRDIVWKSLRSGVWEYTVPCIRTSDGMPFAWCSRCEDILAHPATNRTGTNALKNHPLSKKCKKQATANGQKDITELLIKKKVSILIITMINTK